MQRIRAPKGFRFVVRKLKYGHVLEWIKFYLYDNDHRFVGCLSLEQYKKNHFRTHSFLNAEFRGKGLGALLYTKAINWCHQNNFGVMSSGNSSEMAARVWNGKSIRKYFKIKKTAGRIDEKSKIDYSTWRAYPK